MELLAVIILIYGGGPLGGLLVLIGLVQIVRKKNAGPSWIILGIILIAIAAYLSIELSKVNFGL